MIHMHKSQTLYYNEIGCRYLDSVSSQVTNENFLRFFSYQLFFCNCDLENH